MKSTSELMCEEFERALHRWRHRTREAAEVSLPPKRPAFTIAISRQSGALGGTVAHAVAAKLKWPVFDRELLEKIAESSGFRAKLLEAVDERKSSWLAERMAAFAGAPPVTENLYVEYLVQTLRTLATEGHAVIVGRGAALLLPPETTLKVRLVASFKDRVARISQKLDVSGQEAESYVRKFDRQRTEFVKDHFHRDPADPEQYDLILNTSRFSPPQCAELVVQALQKLEASLKEVPSTSG